MFLRFRYLIYDRLAIDRMPAHPSNLPACGSEDRLEQGCATPEISAAFVSMTIDLRRQDRSYGVVYR